MNINLISPEENGNDYTIRFKEDVIIPENSSVYLNFASFSRENGVEFFDDQTLTIISDKADIRPTNIPTQPFTKNRLFATNKNAFTIPAGQYTYRILYKKITDGINSLLTQADNTGDLSRYRAVAQSDLDKSSKQFLEAEIDLSLGIMKQDILEIDKTNPPSFTIDTANKRNCIANDDAVYIKNNGNATVPAGQVKTLITNLGGITLTGSSFVGGTSTKTNGDEVAVATTGGSGTGLTVDYNVSGGSIADFGVIGIASTIGTFVVGAIDKVDEVVADVATTGGLGIGLTVSYTVVGNTIPNPGAGAGDLKIFSGGSGYSVGDVITISSSGTANTTFQIATIGNGISINSGGSNYVVGDTITVSSTGDQDTTFDVATIDDGLGPKDRTAGTYVNIATTTSGAGTGLTVNFTVVSFGGGLGGIPAFGSTVADTKINQWGTGYSVGDTITVDLTSAGASGTPCGGTGATVFKVSVLTPSSVALQPIFDNYALSTERYWYLNYDDDTPIKELNIITFETKSSGSQMNFVNDAVVIGLQSHPVCSTGIYGAVGTFPSDARVKTGGVNAVSSTLDGTGTSGQYRNPLQFPPDNNSSNSKKILSGLVNITIDCRTNAVITAPLFVVKTAIGTSTGSPNLAQFKGQQEKIGGMKQVFSVPLSTISGYHMDNRFKGGLYTYYATDNMGNRNLYFRVLNFNVVHDANLPMNLNQQLIIYDSKTDPTNPAHFSDTFFLQTNTAWLDYDTGELGNGNFTAGSSDKTNGAYTNFTTTVDAGSIGVGASFNFTVAGGEIDATTVVAATNGYNYKIGDTITFPGANQGLGGTTDATIVITSNGEAGRKHKYDSQMPLCVQASALAINSGFRTIRIANYTQDYAKPITALLKYEIEATEELANYINSSTAKDRLEPDFISKDLFPNTGDAMNPNIIHLENMNLDWRNESYSIYINELPIKSFKNNNKQRSGGYGKTVLANCPVPFSDGQTYKASEKQLITSVYKPNYQVINNLYNQTLATNHFKVEIRKLASDKPANEILKSIVNFTIVPPSDYKGNLNSIASL